MIFAMAKWLIILGIISILVGIAWPWISRLELGHLPGDIYIRRKGFTLFFPFTTSLVLSLLLSLILWIFRR